MKIKRDGIGHFPCGGIKQSVSFLGGTGYGCCTWTGVSTDRKPHVVGWAGAGDTRNGALALLEDKDGYSKGKT